MTNTKARYNAFWLRGARFSWESAPELLPLDRWASLDDAERQPIEIQTYGHELPPLGWANSPAGRRWRKEGKVQ
jgi:hypothetical protein